MFKGRINITMVLIYNKTEHITNNCYFYFLHQKPQLHYSYPSPQHWEPCTDLRLSLSHNWSVLLHSLSKRCKAAVSVTDGCDTHTPIERHKLPHKERDGFLWRLDSALCSLRMDKGYKPWGPVFVGGGTVHQMAHCGSRALLYSTGHTWLQETQGNLTFCHSPIRSLLVVR